MAFIDTVRAWVVANQAASIFFTIMAAFAVFGLLKYLVPMFRRSRAFQAAADRISEHSGSEFPSAPFEAKYNWLNELWSEYRSSYSDASVEIGGETFSPVAAGEFFTRTRVLRGYNRKVALALAGVFLGLGILGTFWGLVLGLRNVDIAGAEQSLQSMNRLLSGMSTAFWSSIGGISLSILWLLADRWVFNRLRSRVQAFLQEVHGHWPATSPDRAVFRALSLQREQKKILQNLGTDMAQAFQEAIDKSFSQELSPSLSSIDDTLEQVASQVRDEQAEALDEMAAAFQERLMGSVQEQFDELAKVISDATEWQQRVTDDVGTLYQQVTELSETNTDLLENSAEAADRFLASVEGLNQTHEQLSEITQNLEKVAGQTAGLSEELRSQSEVFAEANEEIRTELAEQLDLVQEQVELLGAFWDDMHGDLEGLSDSLSKNLTEFTSMTEEKLGQVFNRFDSEMATVVEHLGGTLAELREVTEELGPAIERVERTLDETLEPISDSRDEVAELAGSIRALESLPRHLESASREMETAREALEQLHGGIENLNGRLGDGGEGGASDQAAPGDDVKETDDGGDSGGSEGWSFGQ